VICSVIALSAAANVNVSRHRRADIEFAANPFQRRNRQDESNPRGRPFLATSAISAQSPPSLGHFLYRIPPSALTRTGRVSVCWNCEARWDVGARGRPVSAMRSIGRYFFLLRDVEGCNFGEEALRVWWLA